MSDTYREEFLTVVLAVLEGVTDKDFDNAIERADKLLTKVDKCVKSGRLPDSQPSEDKPSDPPPFDLPAWCQFKQHIDGGSLIRQLGHGVELRIGYTGGEPSQQWWEDTLAYLADIPPKQTDGVKLGEQDEAA